MCSQYYLNEAQRALQRFLHSINLGMVQGRQIWGREIIRQRGSDGGGSIGRATQDQMVEKTGDRLVVDGERAHGRLHPKEVKH